MSGCSHVPVTEAARYTSRSWDSHAGCDSDARRGPDRVSSDQSNQRGWAADDEASWDDEVEEPPTADTTPRRGTHYA